MTFAIHAVYQTETSRTRWCSVEAPSKEDAITWAKHALPQTPHWTSFGLVLSWDAFPAQYPDSLRHYDSADRDLINIAVPYKSPYGY